MSGSHALSAVGLVLDIAGAVVVWRWGLPPADSHNLLLESAPPKAERERAERQQRRLSRSGLVLLGLGFAFQLCGVLTA